MENENLRRGSSALICLESTWAMVRQLEPCLPSCTIVLFAEGHRKHRLGHFASCVWRTDEAGGGHEVAINPLLFERPEELLGTLMHEAVHGLLFSWGLNGGCGPDGCYHREEFRNVSRKLGLSCEFSNRRYGWNITGWPTTGVPTRYHDILQLLRDDIPFGLARTQQSNSIRQSTRAGR